MTPGPGEYKESNYITRVRNPEIRLDSGIKRPDNFTKVSTYNAEPGMYQKGEPTFGSDAKPIRMGSRPKERQNNAPGPGQYNVAAAESLTKVRNPNIRFDFVPDRPDNFTKP